MLEVQNLLPNGIHVNTHGLPALPNELYLEILSHLPAIPIPQDVWIDDEPNPYRQLTLYYLSQTCQSLRKFFLKYAWERIEVFGGMWTPKGRLTTKAERNNHSIRLKAVSEKKLVDEIFRQFDTVIKNPDLLQYVCIANLTIPKYTRDVVVPEIALNLSLLPNLHTLQLLFQFFYGDKQQVFSDFRYLNVHTLSFSYQNPYPDVLVSCPNTKYFSIHKDRIDPFHRRPLFEKECLGHVEKLGVLTDLESHVAEIIRFLPRLRDLSFDCQNLRSGAYFDSLSSLPLHTIRIRLDVRPPYVHPHFIPATSDERRKWIDLASRILAKCPQDEVATKKVIVRNLDKTVDVYGV